MSLRFLTARLQNPALAQGARSLSMVVALIWLTGHQALSAEPPVRTDIDKLVTAAASYQSGQSLEPFRRIEELVRQATAEPAQRPAVEAGLIKLLERSATFEARRFACKELGIIGSKAALPVLRSLLKDPETTGIACLALTTYPPGPADALLREALPAASGQARIQIINALGDRRDPRAVSVLAQQASQADPAVSDAAIQALGKIGNRAAWKALSNLRRSPPPGLEQTLTVATLRCAERLAATGDPKIASSVYEQLLSPNEPAYVRRSALAAVMSLDHDKGDARISRVIESSDAILKPVAIAQVRELPAKNASERFGGMLTRLSPPEQVWMLQSLTARGDTAARQALAKALGSDDQQIRRTAIASLGQIGDASTVRLLARAAEAARDPEDSRAIHAALVGLPGGQATDQEMIANLKTASATARVCLITAIAQRQGIQANPTLLEQAAGPDPGPAKAAVRALARTGTATDASSLIALLSKPLDPTVRAELENATAQVLARIPDSPRRTALVENALKQAQSSETRASLIGLLPACGDAQALAALQRAFGANDPGLRDAALRALAEWPDISAWDGLLGIYASRSDGPLRAAALGGLVRLAGEENAHADEHLAERYSQLLKGAREDTELKLILGAMAGAARPETLQLALPLLSNAGVRAEAEVAVKKIAEAIKAQHPEAAKEALERLKTH